MFFKFIFVFKIYNISSRLSIILGSRKLQREIIKSLIINKQYYRPYYNKLILNRLPLNTKFNVGIHIAKRDAQNEF